MKINYCPRSLPPRRRRCQPKRKSAKYNTQFKGIEQEKGDEKKTRYMIRLRSTIHMRTIKGVYRYICIFMKYKYAVISISLRLTQGIYMYVYISTCVSVCNLTLIFNMILAEKPTISVSDVLYVFGKSYPEKK